jgi:hypothetical protein
MKIIDVYIFKKNQFITSTSLKCSLKNSQFDILSDLDGEMLNKEAITPSFR